ncbi:unnamed protein product [Calicophoron daubneyi]|uniref:Uncharacterized protein n=1 Tax=Calicophoron daubneyi TaxID=300641 RepID=A0AAV2TMC6_CALDB
MKHSDSGDQPDVYLVENIVDRRVRRGKVEYRVRWKGFPPEQDSWEPFANIRESCLRLIQDFHSRYREIMHKKRRYSVPVTPHKQPPTQDPSNSASQSVHEISNEVKPEETIVDKNCSSGTRNQVNQRIPKKGVKQVVSLSLTQPTPTSPNSIPSDPVVNYGGSVSLNSDYLLTPNPMGANCQITTASADSTTNKTNVTTPNSSDHVSDIGRLAKTGTVPGSEIAATTAPTISSNSGKIRRIHSKTQSHGTPLSKLKSPELLKPTTPPTALSSCPKSVKQKTRTTPVDYKQTTISSVFEVTHLSKRSPKRSPKTSGSNSLENGQTESNRKSVTIMLKTSPTHEFHNTKALEINQFSNPSVALTVLPKSQETKPVPQPATPGDYTVKTLPPKTGHSTEASSLDASSDSIVAKVLDVILQFKQNRRRPVQESVLSVCKQRYSLPEEITLSTLNSLVSQGQLHEIGFTNGVSYRFSSRVVAKGDLYRHPTLSAKIKAKYASNKKRPIPSSVGRAWISDKRASVSNADGSGVIKRPRREHSSVTRSRRLHAFCYNRHWSGDHSSYRQFKPTGTQGSNYVSSVDWRKEVARFDVESDRNVTCGMGIGGSEGEGVSRSVKPCPHLQHGTRVYIVPPASPVKDTNIELRINGLPHRRLVQPNQSGDHGTDSSTTVPGCSGANNTDVPEVNKPANHQCTVPRRSSIRQTEAIHKFKSILVKKNVDGGFTEVWLQSPGSPLKNAFTIQVLEELTAMLNQAVFDTSRLVMISGMGTVFSSGIDLSILTGPLPTRSCLSVSPIDSSSCASSVCSVGACTTPSSTGLSSHLPPSLPSTAPDAVDGVGFPNDVTSHSDNMCCCCCYCESDPVENFARSEATSKPNHFPHSHFPHQHSRPNLVNSSCYPLAPLDPMASQRLGSALRAFLLALTAFPKPVVAGVNGPALGLAVAMLPLCDLVYVSDAATFHMPYTRLCQTPEGGSSFTLASLVGIPLANELLLAGRKLTAREAVQRGIASDILFPKSFKQELVMRCHKLAASSPAALETTKCIMRMQYRERIEFVINTECRKLVELWQTTEFRRAAVDFILRDMGDYL